MSEHFWVDTRVHSNTQLVVLEPYSVPTILTLPARYDTDLT